MTAVNFDDDAQVYSVQLDYRKYFSKKRIEKIIDSIERDEQIISIPVNEMNRLAAAFFAIQTGVDFTVFDRKAIDEYREKHHM